MKLTDVCRLLFTAVLFTTAGAMAASSQKSSPGHHGLERENNLVFAQMAVGEGIETNLSLLNVVDPQRVGPNGTPLSSGTVHFFAQDGSALPVRINGGEPTAEFAFSLEPFEMVWLLLTAEGPTTPGWMLIEVDQRNSDDDGEDDSSSAMRGPGPRNGDDGGSSDGNDDFESGERLLATAYFTTQDDQGAMISRVGVIPSKFLDDDYFTTVLAAQFSPGINTGAAIVNTGSSANTVQLRLRDVQGTLVASAPLTLEAGNQTARFIDELFPGSVPEGFQGFLEIDADSSGIVTLGLLQTDLILTSLPTRHYGRGSSDDSN